MRILGSAELGEAGRKTGAGIAGILSGVRPCTVLCTKCLYMLSCAMGAICWTLH